MTFEFLCEQNVERYIEYLRKAFSLEPDLMTAERLDEDGIRSRIGLTFYQSTPSILAMVDGGMAGRIEYHFYGCLQDGYRMAYVDWVYVLPEFRRRGVARGLFREFEKDCARHGIHQYYLIRSEEPEADRFYAAFAGAESSREPILRKCLSDE